MHGVQGAPAPSGGQSSGGASSASWLAFAGGCAIGAAAAAGGAYALVSHYLRSAADRGAQDQDGQQPRCGVSGRCVPSTQQLGRSVPQGRSCVALPGCSSFAESPVLGGRLAWFCCCSWLPGNAAPTEPTLPAGPLRRGARAANPARGTSHSSGIRRLLRRRRRRQATPRGFPCRGRRCARGAASCAQSGCDWEPLGLLQPHGCSDRGRVPAGPCCDARIALKAGSVCGVPMPAPHLFRSRPAPHPAVPRHAARAARLLAAEAAAAQRRVAGAGGRARAGPVREIAPALRSAAAGARTAALANAQLRQASRR